MDMFREDFEQGKPFRDWSDALKKEYDQRLDQIIEDWRKNGEIRLLGLTRQYLDDVSPKTFKLHLLDGRIVGNVNLLLKAEASRVIYREMTIHELIEYVITSLDHKR